MKVTCENCKFWTTNKKSTGDKSYGYCEKVQLASESSSDDRILGLPHAIMTGKNFGCIHFQKL